MAPSWSSAAIGWLRRSRTVASVPEVPNVAMTTGWSALPRAWALTRTVPSTSTELIATNGWFSRTASPSPAERWIRTSDWVWPVVTASHATSPMVSISSTTAPPAWSDGTVTTRSAKSPVLPASQNSIPLAVSRVRSRCFSPTWPPPTTPTSSSLVPLPGRPPSTATLPLSLRRTILPSFPPSPNLRYVMAPRVDSTRTAGARSTTVTLPSVPTNHSSVPESVCTLTANPGVPSDLGSIRPTCRTVLVRDTTLPDAALTSARRVPPPACTGARTTASRPRAEALPDTSSPATLRTLSERRSRMLSAPPWNGHEATQRSSSLIEQRPVPITLAGPSGVARLQPLAVSIRTPRSTMLVSACPAEFRTVGNWPGTAAVTREPEPSLPAIRARPAHAVPTWSRRTRLSDSTVLMVSPPVRPVATTSLGVTFSPGFTAYRRRPPLPPDPASATSMRWSTSDPHADSPTVAVSRPSNTAALRQWRRRAAGADDEAEVGGSRSTPCTVLPAPPGCFRAVAGRGRPAA